MVPALQALLDCITNMVMKLFLKNFVDTVGMEPGVPFWVFDKNVREGVKGYHGQERHSWRHQQKKDQHREKTKQVAEIE